MPRMRALGPFVAVVGAATLAACATKEEPTPQDGAKYLGFVAGETRTYAVGESSETHELRDSSVQGDGISVDLLAKDGGGFAVEARSFTLGITGTSSNLLRFSDCVNPCGEPKKPIPFVDWPLEDGGEHETTVDVKLTENGAEERTEEQTHAILVGAEEEIEVPAGKFDAFSVSWTITVGEESEAHLIYIAANEGVVQWKTPDGLQLDLSDVAR
jgi:hypothetical protein